MEHKRQYKFSWDLLGDIQLGRPNLGPLVRLEVYRLLLFSLRDVLEQRIGAEATDEVFYESGRIAGCALYSHLVGNVNELSEFVRKVQQALREMRIGILRVEQANLDQGMLVLTVDEDLDCSGLPETGMEICKFDEGLISGLLESYMGKPFNVTEVDCWCTGTRTCRFVAEVVS